MRSNISGSSPLTGRARFPARREGVLEANDVFSVLDQSRLWASGTIRRLPDESGRTQRWEGSRPRDPLFPKPSVFVDRVIGIRL
jgi:hypothetical protein